MTSGVLGVAALCFFLIKGLFNFKKYFAGSDEDYRYKLVLLSFILVFYAYCSYFYEGEYGIFYSVYKPYFMTGPFMITLFIFMYIAFKKAPVAEVTEEVTTYEAQ